MSRQDSEPPMVAASRWVNEVTSIALQMALPPAAGYWLDRRFGTDPWFVVSGACLGMLVSMISLVQLSKRVGAKSFRPKSAERQDSTSSSPKNDSRSTAAQPEVNQDHKA